MSAWLVWYGHVSRSSGLAKTILQGTVKGRRRHGGQRKRWEDSIREWTGLEFGKTQRAMENREKWIKTGCKIICGAPTTLAVKRKMMMMMMMMMSVGFPSLGPVLFSSVQSDGDVAQLVEHRIGTPQTQVRFPDTARDFSPKSQLSVQTLLR